VENKAVAVIEKDTKDIVAQAGAIVIKNQAEYEKADAFLVADKMLQKKIHEAFDKIVDDSYRTYVGARETRKEYLKPVLEAEKVVNRIMVAYDDKMEQKRIEEQRRVEAKARAEEEKKRKELEERAARWTAKGKEAKAEALQEEAEEVQIVAPIIAPKIDKIQGACYQINWKFRITDVNKISRKYMMPDMVKLGMLARAMKGTISEAGVEFYSEKIRKRRI